MQEHNSKLEEQIQKFDQLCKHNNVGITIHELNADDVINKLKIIEKESLPIWEAFIKHYGNGFFNKMIEREFGINPDTHEEIGNKFGEEVNNIRITSNNKFEQLRKETNERIETMKDALKKIKTEYERLQIAQEEEITKAKMEIQKL